MPAMNRSVFDLDESNIVQGDDLLINVLINGYCSLLVLPRKYE